MKPDAVEQALARYAPPGPPPELKARVIGTALRRERSKRRAAWLLALAGAVALTGLLFNLSGDRVYDSAERLAQGTAIHHTDNAVTRASLLSTDTPGVKTLLAWNGGSHD